MANRTGESLGEGKGCQCVWSDVEPSKVTYTTTYKGVTWYLTRKSNVCQYHL